MMSIKKKVPKHNIIPDFRINVGGNKPSIEDNILDLEAFHRRIVNFVLDRLYGDADNNILCYFIDEEGNRYTSVLEREGYEKSLNKSLEYFSKNENYENCIIIKKLLTQL